MVKKECFSELIDHGHGKYTLFGRVLADTPDDPGRQNVRSADITTRLAWRSSTTLSARRSSPRIPTTLIEASLSFRARANTIPMPVRLPSWPRDGGTMQIQANMSANLS